MVVLGASLHGWLQRHGMAQSLAQEAARSLATADDWDSGLEMVRALELRAEARLDSSIRSCPVSTGCFQMAASGTLERGGRVDAAVSVWMPGFVVPFAGEVGGYWDSVTHHEVVDRHRTFR
jgi:hypothetical protein